MQRGRYLSVSNQQSASTTAIPRVPTALPEYTVEFPSATSLIPSLQFFRAWCGNPNEKKGEGIYYRLVRQPADGRSCLQLILYYRVQWFPYHPNDFAPMNIYLESGGEVSRILYDSFHHTVATIIEPRSLYFTVFAPWHAFKPGRQGWPISQMQTAYHAMEDSVILRWWFLRGKSQLKLRSKLVDPWHAGLTKQSGEVRPTFRDEGKCPVCNRTVQMDTMHIQGAEFSKACRCALGHSFTVRYDSERQVIETTRS